MIHRLSYSLISGRLTAPASKSVMIRAVAAGALAEGTSVLLNPSYCDDTLAALDIIKVLGAEVEKLSDRILIKGIGLRGEHGGHNRPGGEDILSLNCGESGLSLRMFSSVASLFDKNTRLSGKASLMKRPLGDLAGPLEKMGVEVKTNKGFLPVEVKGPMQGGEISLDGSLSSQFLTGLLMSLPLTGNDSLVEVDKLKSKPYIDLSLELMRDFGVYAENDNYKHFTIPGRQHYQAREYFIEGDWSGAALLLVAAAVAGRVELTGLRQDSSQADKAIIEALKLAGANVEMSDEICIVERAGLNAFEFDISECPDLAPPLVSLAANCKGISILSGTSRLAVKESNRSAALKEEFARMGVDIELGEDVMKIKGSEIRAARVYSHNDHRIAMAAAVAALNSSGEISIDASECVAKSYPAFFDDIKSLGGRVERL